MCLSLAGSLLICVIIPFGYSAFAISQTVNDSFSLAKVLESCLNVSNKHNVRRDAFELLLLIIETMQTNSDEQIIQFSQVINTEPFLRFVDVSMLGTVRLCSLSSSYKYNVLGLQMIQKRIKRKWFPQVRILRQQSTSIAYALPKGSLHERMR